MPTMHLIPGFAVFKDEEYSEAENYLDDLKKRYPNDTDVKDLEIETVHVGRPPNHKELIWGSEGVWDLVDEKLYAFQRGWFWAHECDSNESIAKGDTRSRYVAIFSTLTTNYDLERFAKRLYGGIRVKVATDGINCTVLQV